MIYNRIDETIGKTPLLRLRRLERELGCVGRIIAKLEYFNPSGSVKDRVARAMVDDAEQKGVLRPGGVIIEPTSGNTGIGLASVAAARGYRAIIVMPDTMSIERRKLMAAYGAEVVLTEGHLGMAGAIKKAEELSRSIPGSMVAGQFDNPANPKIHKMTTGPEIYNETNGKIDFFVCGVGTGGTITGVGEYLKERIPNIQVIAVEPSSSAVLSGESAGSHGLQGIGAGFVPAVLNTEVYDQVVKVSEAEAFAAARELGRYAGVLCGISSGAALHVAITLAKKTEYKNKNIVVLLPDTGERYLSSELYQ